MNIFGKRTKEEKQEKRLSFHAAHTPYEGIDTSIIDMLKAVEKRFGLDATRCLIEDPEEEGSLKELQIAHRKQLKLEKKVEQVIEEEALSHYRIKSRSVKIIDRNVFIPLVTYNDKKVGILYGRCKKRAFCKTDLMLLENNASLIATSITDYMSRKHLVESTIASRALALFFVTILSLFMYITVLTRYFTDINQINLLSSFIAPAGLLVLTNRYFYTFKDWGFYSIKKLKEIKHYLHVTVVICILLTALKYFLMLFDPVKYGTTLFSWDVESWKISTVTIYFLAVASQEIGARVIPYTLLKKAYRGSFRIFLTVIISFVVFSLPHVRLPFVVFLFASLAGLVWIILYIKTPNYYGITLAHFLIGLYTLNLLGFSGLFV